MKAEHEAAGLTDMTANGSVIIWRPEFGPTEWDELAALILPSLDYVNGEFNIDDLKQMCQLGAAHLWGYYEDDVAKLGMVTCFTTYPRKKYLHALAYGGSGTDKVFPFWPIARKFMFVNDCEMMTAAVRPAMQKLLARHGFAPLYTQVARSAMEVSDEQKH